MKGELNVSNLIDVLKETNVTAFLDNWGPTHVLQVYDPETNMHGTLVIDNISLGPGCGSIKIAPTITPHDVFQHARTMTYACALADVRLGGAGAGIRANPFEIDKIKFIKSFGRKISPFVPDQYIATPNQYIGMNEMAAFVEEVGDRKGATGKPESMGGIPYELGGMGLGMGVVIEEGITRAQSSLPLPRDMTEARIVIQGFGNIGYSLAKCLSNKGARIIAISDESCSIYNPEGIDIKGIQEYSQTNGMIKPLKHWTGIKKQLKDEILKVDCDIFVCTSENKIITEENVQFLRTKCVVEGVNNPITPIADRMLHNKGILVLPDILSMVSSAVSSYAEYRMDTPEMAFSLIESKIQKITRNVVDRALRSGIPPRRVAKEIARERILKTGEEEPWQLIIYRSYNRFFFPGTLEI